MPAHHDPRSEPLGLRIHCRDGGALVTRQKPGHHGTPRRIEFATDPAPVDRPNAILDRIARRRVSGRIIGDVKGAQLLHQEYRSTTSDYRCLSRLAPALFGHHPADWADPSAGV